MRVRRFLGIGAAVVLVIFAAFSVLAASLRDQLFDFEMKPLDHWVQSGGDIKAVQAEVVKPCGKLIMSQAGAFERLQLITFYRSEFDFRVDVCVKMTVNRRYPQPEFQNSNVEHMICGDKNSFHEVFRHLCQRSGLPT